MQNESIRTALAELLGTQPFGVLATWGKGRPYSSLVAFKSCDNGKRILFATTRATRKYANIIELPYVAMLMDNRSNQESDFKEAIAVTADGKAYEPIDDEFARYKGLYLDKHPNLASFVDDPECALLVMEVEVYHVVTNFQNVVEVIP